MKKNYFKKRLIMKLLVFAFLIIPYLTFAQGIDFSGAGSSLVGSFEKGAGIIIGLAGIFVVYKNIGQFIDHDGNPFKGVMNIAIYVFIVIAIIGIYRYVKTLSI